MNKNNETNIVLGKTLEEYNQKYKNRKHRLIKYSEEQVFMFDKNNGYYVYDKEKKTLRFNKYLLKGRTWWLISNTYYEVPRVPTLTWFRNLNTACQIGTCVLLGGVVTTSIVLPCVLINHHDDIKPEIVIDESILDSLTYTIDKDSNGNVKVSFKEAKNDMLLGLKNVKVGDVTLNPNTDYKYNDNVLIIKKEVLEKYKGKVYISPDIAFEKPEYIDIVSNGNTIKFKEDSTISALPETFYVRGKYHINREVNVITTVATKAFYLKEAFTKYVKNLIIEDGITNIEERSFYGCQAIETIKLPNTLEEIGDQGFGSYVGEEPLKYLKKINIPLKVKKMATPFAILLDDNAEVTFDNKEDVWIIGGPAGTITDFNPNDSGSKENVIRYLKGEVGGGEYRWSINEKERFLRKYKDKSNNFQNSTKKYSKSQVKYSIGGAQESEFESFEYSENEFRGLRVQGGGYNFQLAGGELTHTDDPNTGINAYFEELSMYGDPTIKCVEDGNNIGYIVYLYETFYEERIFNEKGYTISYIVQSADEMKINYYGDLS